MLFMASSSSSSSFRRPMRHQVFLSFRGEDTGLGFTARLFKALEDKGISVFFYEKKLDRGEQLSHALSNAIAASSISIIVLSENYASSKSCLAELSLIRHCKYTRGLIVLPIFYHVDPFHVRHLGGTFETSFENHASQGLKQVEQWRKAFAEVGKLKGWHIDGGKFDRPETEYIKNIVDDVAKNLRNSEPRPSVCDELVGIDDQKNFILGLIEQEENRVIGLWGPGGIGKTTLADAVFLENYSKFEDCWFLQNVSEKIEKQGTQIVRNKLLSKLLNEFYIHIDTPSIESPYRERLNSKMVFVVLDDVSQSDQIHDMGINHFGPGSKIIVTSRDRGVLSKGGAEVIYEVDKLNKNDSLQLFSTFAFKQLNPDFGFQYLSNDFVEYAKGNPLVLKVLGTQLYKKCKEDWESEVRKLKEYGQPEILEILKSSFDELSGLEKNVFLDIACFFKGNYKTVVEKILSCLYKGAACGINNLLDKSLLEIRYFYILAEISMHDMLEEMGKKIVRQESKDSGNHSRLWNLKDVDNILKCNKVNKSIEGIKLQMTGFEDLLSLFSHGFEKMRNLRYLDFYTKYGYRNEELLANALDSVSLPDELRYLSWESYPFKSLSPNFNPKNLVELKLSKGNMEELWNEDYQDLVNLRAIDLSGCKKLRKIPNLSGAINLQRLICLGCESLVELPCLDHLKSLKMLTLSECHKLKKFPELPNVISELNLSRTGIEEVSDSIQHLVGLGSLRLSHSRVKNVSSNISKLESLRYLDVGHCKSLKTLPELPPYLLRLDAKNCTSLEEVSFPDRNFNSFHDGYGAPPIENFFMSFSNCRSLNQDAMKNIWANAMLQIHSLAQKWARKKRRSRGEYNFFQEELFCCFPGNEVPADVFNYGSMNSSINLKLSPNGCGGRRFLAFAICIVPNFTCARKDVQVSCKYQLTAASGETFKRCDDFDVQNLMYKYNCEYEGDHVFIISSEYLIIMDNDYEEASFKFCIKSLSGGEEIKVEKCGVYVFFMDAESYTSNDIIQNYQVFLSFRGKDTRLNFTSHLLKALKDTGMNVFFDEDKLEKGEPLSLALSQAIAASSLSIIVLSADYASSNSCLAELSDIMDRKHNEEHIVLPIFYHVDPSDVRKLGGSFKTSFEKHESNRPLDEVKRWKAAFAGVGKLKGWHIDEDKSDRSEAECVKDVVQYVIEKLNIKSRSVSEELVGINAQKKTVLGLIEQQESRVIGLWGMGGIGKTTLAEAVYNEISLTFQSRCFVQNVREKIEKHGKASLRNELLSKLLNSETCIDTPSIGYPLIQQRLSTIKAIVVLDDVNDSDQIDFMGVKYFGEGSKIIVTSRDKQVLINAEANKIHEVEKLNENNSLQLFSTSAFKLLNPPDDFQDLSNKFVQYAQGSPLALKVLGSKLYKKSREHWESEVDKLKECAEAKISQILQSSYDGLNRVEKNIFLDIACFFNWENKDNTETILSSYYMGAASGINNLVEKCLFDISPLGSIYMHDMFEETGKDIVRQESEDPENRSRLWNLKDVNRVLKYDEVNKSVQGIKLTEDLQLLCSRGFENMLNHGLEKMRNLRYIHFYSRYLSKNKKRLVDKIDSIPLPDELRYLYWMFYPFKCLSPSFNTKNLVVLKLRFGDMEQLWNEDYQDLGNLRTIDISECKKLRKIPNLSGAINLRSLICSNCESLVELPSFNALVSLENLNLRCCTKLKKIPNLSGVINLKWLTCKGCVNLVELPCMDHLKSLELLNCEGCVNLVELPSLDHLKSLEILL